jgi:methionine synthase II (cobalamin-independent)
LRWAPPRIVLRGVRPEHFGGNHDCGLFETPRWIGEARLRGMVAGGKIVCKELRAA